MHRLAGSSGAILTGNMKVMGMAGKGVEGAAEIDQRGTRHLSVVRGYPSRLLARTY